MKSKKLSLIITKGLRVYFAVCLIFGIIASFFLDITLLTVVAFIALGVITIYITSKWIKALEVSISNEKE